VIYPLQRPGAPGWSPQTTLSGSGIENSR
jgi:hypothetical protein